MAHLSLQKIEEAARPCGSLDTIRYKIKVIEFKAVSPFFEWERDGIQPFTVRRVDTKDSRFRSLARWKPGRSPWLPVWYIKITRVESGEYFYRKLDSLRLMGLSPQYSPLLATPHSARDNRGRCR